MLNRVVVLGLAVVGLILAGCDGSSTSGEKKSSGTKAASSKVEPPTTAKSATEKKPSTERTRQNKTVDVSTSSARNDSSRKDGPQWVCDPSVIDFGEVWEGAIVEREFKFRNDGNAVLIVDKPKAHCTCSSGDNWTKEVPPGGTGIIPFVLKTRNKKPGPLQEYIDIPSNAINMPTARIWLKGIIRDVCLPEVVFDLQYEQEKAAGNEPPRWPVKTSFGKITGTEKLHRVVKLTNTSRQPLSLMLLPLPENSPFKAELRETVPAEEFELTVTAEPPIPVGRHTTPIRFKTNVPERPLYHLYAYAHVPPRVEIRPFTERMVINQERFPAAERTINIANHGETPVEILSIATSEPRYDISLVSSGPGQPQEHTITIRFPGGTSYQPPEYGEVIEITTSDPEFSKYRVWIDAFMDRPRVLRPADKPLVMHPVELPKPG